MTMDGRLSLAVAQPRFYAVLVGFFAALALLLAASGIYGLLSYTVAQRRGELGIRMALGARRGDILGLVVRQGGMLVATGAAVGLAAAAAASRVLESFLYGVATDDRLTSVAAPLVLVTVALVACRLPARRATRGPSDGGPALRVGRPRAGAKTMKRSCASRWVGAGGCETMTRSCASRNRRGGAYEP